MNGGVIMDSWNVKSDIKSTLDNTKEKVSEVYQDVKDKVESTSEQLKEKASDIYKDNKEYLNSLEQSMEEYSEQLTSKIKEYPLTSLAIAGGIGFLLSKLLRK